MGDVDELEPDVTTTFTGVLLLTDDGGTVQLIDTKLVTVGFLHTLPSIVTTEDDEKPVPLIFNR